MDRRESNGKVVGDVLLKHLVAEADDPPRGSIKRRHVAISTQQ